MAASPDPAALSPQSRETLDHLEKHATTHNLSWDDVFGLLREATDVTEEGHDRYKVTLGEKHVYVEKPTHDAVDEQTVLQLRDLFKAAGYVTTKD